MAVRLLAFIFLPGVIIHELSHYIAARLLGVHATNMEFFPQTIGDKVKLGSVTIQRTDILRRSVIGVAPVIIGLTVLFGSFWFFSRFAVPLFSWQALLLGYVIFEVGNTMFSSKKDVEGSAVFLVACLVCLILIFLFFPWALTVAMRFLAISAPTVRIADIVLGIAILINSIVLLVL